MGITTTEQPELIVVSGLPGSGQLQTAFQLSQTLGGVCIDEDTKTIFIKTIKKICESGCKEGIIISNILRKYNLVTDELIRKYIGLVMREIEEQISSIQLHNLGTISIAHRIDGPLNNVHEQLVNNRNIVLGEEINKQPDDISVVLASAGLSSEERTLRTVMAGGRRPILVNLITDPIKISKSKALLILTEKRGTPNMAEGWTEIMDIAITDLETLKKVLGKGHTDLHLDLLRGIATNIQLN